MVKDTRFAHVELCKGMQGRNREFFVIPVYFVIAEDKRKGIEFVSVQLFSCELSDKFKFLIGQNVVLIFRDYSPLLIFSA